MMQVSKEIFFNYLKGQGLISINHDWSNSTSTLTVVYMKWGKERARIEQGPTGDKYFVTFPKNRKTSKNNCQVLTMDADKSSIRQSHKQRSGT